MDAATLTQTIIGIEPSAAMREKSNRPAVTVPAERLLPLMEQLRRRDALAFDLLLDHCGIDWSEQGRIELVYNLFSTLHGHSLMVTCSVPRDNPVAPTVSGLWEIAQWQEREVYDLMGVLYDGHADLRRLFLEDDWQGYPLRKDYKDPDMLEFPQ